MSEEKKEDAVSKPTVESPAVRYKLNLIKGPDDPRDIKLTCKVVGTLPPKIDLTKAFPPIWDQGIIGSCTGQASGAVLQYLLNVKKNTLYSSSPSRLFIYTNGRVTDGYPLDEDTGCSIRGAIKGIANFCSPDERQNWWYIQQNAFVKPPPKVYEAALTYKAPNFKYMAVEQNIMHLKTELAQGFPIVLGIAIYDSFFLPATMQTGIIPMPNKSTEKLQGWHAVALVGYEEATKTFLLRNSWGVACGLPEKRGYFKIRYEYVLHPTLAMDIWTMRV